MALTKADKDHIQLVIYKAFDEKVEDKLIPLVKANERHETAIFGVKDDQGHVVTQGLIVLPIEINKLRKAKWILWGVVISLSVLIPIILRFLKV